VDETDTNSGAGDEYSSVPVRFLISTQPGLGHIHPMVPFVQALKAAGHEVAFAASGPFCPTVANLGFEVFSAGVDWDESDAATTLPGFLTGRPAGQLRLFLELADKMSDDLVQIAGRWKADALVREPTEYGAWVASQRIGVPSIVLGIMIRLPGWVLNSLAASEFVQLLSSKQLPPDPDLERLWQDLYLDLVPPSFVPDDWPTAPTVHHIRPIPFDRSGSEVLPEWTRGLGSRPVVYATLGTVFNQAPQAFRCVIDALADKDVDLVVTLGRNLDPRDFGPPPENVHLERYIPQSQLLPLCDAVICHGGYGTLMAALANGLPMLLLPISADQGLGALRATELGFGLSMATHFYADEQVPHLGPDDLDTAGVRLAVERLLEEPGFAAAARAMQSELAAMPGVEHAVSLIERTVSDAH
jgi:UDP:flavonoid glycosyltransferase YjiC (YdhE family)